MLPARIASLLSHIECSSIFLKKDITTWLLIIIINVYAKWRPPQAFDYAERLLLMHYLKYHYFIIDNWKQAIIIFAKHYSSWDYFGDWRGDILILYEIISLSSMISSNNLFDNFTASQYPASAIWQCRGEQSLLYTHQYWLIEIISISLYFD